MDFQSVIFLIHVFVIEVAVVRSETQSKTTASCGSPGIPGMPGVPGSPGGIGSPGSPGIVGAKGEPGVSGNHGRNGSPGKVGPKGEPGARGVQGIAGKYGMPGSPGSVGEKGEPGTPGNPGSEGIAGLRGPAGVKGEPGEGLKSNWKQCVWKREDSKDTGLIQECLFKKKYDSTSLRVFYAGNLRSSGSSNCNRWYFTFGGKECTKPATIEGVVYSPTNSENPLRHRQIEGYCNQLPKGQIRVGFWIGKCQGYGSADGHTGWKSVSRIVVEEVPPPQT